MRVLKVLAGVETVPDVLSHRLEDLVSLLRFSMTLKSPVKKHVHKL